MFFILLIYTYCLIRWIFYLRGQSGNDWSFSNDCRISGMFLTSAIIGLNVLYTIDITILYFILKKSLKTQLKITFYKVLMTFIFVASLSIGIALLGFIPGLYSKNQICIPFNYPENNYKTFQYIFTLIFIIIIFLSFIISIAEVIHLKFFILHSYVKNDYQPPKLSMKITIFYLLLITVFYFSQICMLLLTLISRSNAIQGIEWKLRIFLLIILISSFWRARMNKKQFHRETREIVQFMFKRTGKISVISDSVY